MKSPNNQKKIEHPELGWVTYKKNVRSKRITLRVKADASIVVTLPQRTPYQAAEKVLLQNINWVKEQLGKAQQLKQAKALSYDSTFQVGHKQLCIVPDPEVSAVTIRYGEENIKLSIPSDWKLREAATQEAIQLGIIEALRREAKIYLPQRTRALAAAKGIEINTIRIKNIKTRWGSCSSKKNINLSLYLMVLPFHLIDYVIFHELAHIKHQNHSPAFWRHLEMLLPNASALDQAMKEQQIPF
ncbi:M48 family metallopeptidase [Aureispira anguillae]|uniref:M48 family metallopeptidase n=1 Tax=Aureispira anguillae TaxID=2864201 RepID=A0A916DXC2_9BACT|nr:SprT family zinc-dependent metalloprotease [Aureispira anguillae]BDS14936.1 M48 family metallopeptidase [Aureispira anguillae]